MVGKNEKNGGKNQKFLELPDLARKFIRKSFWKIWPPPKKKKSSKKTKVLRIVRFGNKVFFVENWPPPTQKIKFFEGLVEMFEVHSADTSARKFPLASMGGRVEGLASADPGARATIGASGNLPYNIILNFFGTKFFEILHKVYWITIPSVPWIFFNSEILLFWKFGCKNSVQKKYIPKLVLDFVFYLTKRF